MEMHINAPHLHAWVEFSCYTPWILLDGSPLMHTEKKEGLKALQEVRMVRMTDWSMKTDWSLLIDSG